MTTTLTNYLDKRGLPIGWMLHRRNNDNLFIPYWDRRIIPWGEIDSQSYTTLPDFDVELLTLKFTGYQGCEVANKSFDRNGFRNLLIEKCLMATTI